MIKVEEQGIYNLQGRQVVTPGDLHNRVVVEGEIVQEHSFGGMWLQNVRFYNCTLIKCAFKETFLKKVEFRGCSIICCDFNQATLVECSFVGCSVFRTKMQHARQKSMLILGGRLLQSDFNNSAFEGAQVSSASFKHCRFEQSVWSGRWEGCAFENVRFTDADLRGVLQKDCKFERCPAGGEYIYINSGGREFQPFRVLRPDSDVRSSLAIKPKGE